MTCDELRDFLTLSAAGLLEPSEERKVREHAQVCATCAEHLESFAELAAGLRSLPSPAPPAYLAALVSKEMADYADRRQGLMLAAGSAVLAWAMGVTSWYGYRLWTGDPGTLWLLWSIVPALIAAPVTAGLFRRERRVS